MEFFVSSQTLSVSTYLDPRFKNLAFRNHYTADDIKKTVTEIIVEKINEVTRENQKKPEEQLIKETPVDDAEADIFGDFDKIVAQT
ncbi:unnamed protein product [Acanthoscelides obtectus]|uniref:Uncharacterized protein n=1 Tax=Acanthoscelides obtectus TaxID=200917 RepID=A0A9P0Q4W3_ACAOB|nr:unnamed protein product [Acanthoscelides obtectus]CAK1624336.1 hypothetical protein AOBTE_LOCUS2507 [Acanthoscelides obtectus]